MSMEQKPVTIEQAEALISDNQIRIQAAIADAQAERTSGEPLTMLDEVLGATSKNSK